MTIQLPYINFWFNIAGFWDVHWNVHRTNRTLNQFWQLLKLMETTSKNNTDYVSFISLSYNVSWSSKKMTVFFSFFSSSFCASLGRIRAQPPGPCFSYGTSQPGRVFQHERCLDRLHGVGLAGAGRNVVGRGRFGRSGRAGREDRSSERHPRRSSVLCSGISPGYPQHCLPVPGVQQCRPHHQ